MNRKIPVFFCCAGHRGRERVVLLESMGMESSGSYYIIGVGSTAEGGVRDTAA